MKKFRLVLASVLILMSLVGYAQKIVIYKDGKVVKEYPASAVDSVVYDMGEIEPEPEPTDQSYRYVDLGDGIKWALWNIGAESETEVGGYYVWGDPTGTHVYADGLEGCDMGTASIGGTEADIATAMWGKGWRLPTPEEFETLRDYTFKRVSSYNNVTIDAYVITGSNDNQMLLPRAGAITKAGLLSGYTVYWTGEASDFEKAFYMDCANGVPMATAALKHWALPVRAVYDEKLASGEVDETEQGGNTGENTGSDDSGSSGEVSGGGETGSGSTGDDNLDDDPPVVDVDEKVEVEFVDLGLDVLWATCNLGATKNDPIGNYYAWGDTVAAVKDEWGNMESQCIQDTYKFYVDGKYQDIGKRICGTEYDAATMTLGGGWRMPSAMEFEDLILNCDTVHILSDDGFYDVIGIRFISKIEGYTDKYIDLPCSGMAGNMSIDYSNDSGYYWTGSLLTNNIDREYASALRFFIPSEEVFVAHVQRHSGCVIRPVKDKRAAQ